MGSVNAITVVADAYQRAVLDTIPTTFAAGQEFPLSIGLLLLNTVIDEMNRAGRYWFAETSQQLTYPWTITINGDTRTSAWSLNGVCSANATTPGSTTTLNTIAVNNLALYFTVSTGGAINLYTDSAGLNLVASGPAPVSLPGICTLTQSNASGISGTVTVASGSAENTVASQSLTFAPAIVASYNLSTVASVVIDPKDLTRIRRESDAYEGELSPANYRAFQRKYRYSTPNFQKPQFWANYNNTLYLDSYPDQDYSLTLYYFQDLPLMTTTTGATFIIPDKDIHVVKDGVYAYLCEALGRADYGAAYQLYMKKVKGMVADMSKNTGRPFQAPAGF